MVGVTHSHGRKPGIKNNFQRFIKIQQIILYGKIYVFDEESW